MKKWREYVHYYGITTRMVAFFLLLVIVPYIILAVTVFFYVQNHTINSLGNTNMDTLTVAASSIHTAMNEREDDSMAVYYNGCVELLDSEEPLTEEERTSIQNTLQAISYANTGVQAVYLKTGQDSFYTGRNFTDFLKEMEPYESQIIQAGGKCLWHTTMQYGSAYETNFILARSLNSEQQKNVGILYLILSDKMVQDAMGKLSTEYAQWYLTNAMGTILYCSDNTLIGKATDVSMLSLETSSSYQTYQSQQKEEQLIASYCLMDVNWFCISKINLETLEHSARQLMLPLLSVSLIYAAFLLLMLYFMRKYVFRPLRALKDSMDQYAQDQLSETRVEIVGIGEFRSLSTHFNNMTQRISRLMRAYKEEEDEKNRQKMKTLAAQLSPHFIYNALNTIKWVAVLNHQERIQHLVESLVSIFMNAARADDENYTLRDELELIQNYAVIQKARFMNFDLVTEVEEACLDCRIRKLLIQPIVENAIVHGLNRGKVKNGTVLIQAWIEENNLYIVVADEGVGFDVEQWRNSPKKKEDHTNIGVHNVEEIIQLEYGAPYGLSINSAPGKGTTITYLLPAIRKEEGQEHDSHDHC